MPRFPIALALTLALSAPAFAQAPAAKAAPKPAAPAASKIAPANAVSPALQPPPPEPAHPQDALYRRSPAAARLAESGESSFELQQPQPLMRWSEPNETDRGMHDSRRDRCAHSIKQMRQANASDSAQREGQARRDCQGVRLGG
ncbi:hypothetical protein J5226_05170 [Lysobacter sp. K5869]|uniref:hypothetical protein n=1 Tax=Lysobacter sp. K5869 TaxID=2820808 RepID=UPI001C0609A7|nr:hypothetical protein [Lysobacter sp. K5869]QWP77806.1 hypothetical protein J5226_05170 [Lysobacter sp. K5869]